MKISGIEIEVERKKIKHTHLSVFPPNARVHVSAPIDLPDTDLRSFIISKVPWIRRQVAVVLAQPRQARREYVSGENVYLFGKRYRLVVKKNDVEFDIKVEGHNLVMDGRGLETRDQREAKMIAWYRDELKRALTRIVAKCADVAKEKDVTFEVRRMRNLWGSCNARRRRIAFNLALARVPVRCVEYVVFHELVHLVVPNHSLLFERRLERLMPRWRDAKKELNDFIALPLDV